MKAVCLICKEVLNGRSYAIAGGMVLKHVRDKHPEKYGLVGVILASEKR